MACFINGEKTTILIKKYWSISMQLHYFDVNIKIIRETVKSR